MHFSTKRCHSLHITEFILINYLLFNYYILLFLHRFCIIFDGLVKFMIKHTSVQNMFEI